MINKSVIKTTEIVSAHKKVCEALKILGKVTNIYDGKLDNVKMKLQEIERELFLAE